MNFGRVHLCSWRADCHHSYTIAGVCVLNMLKRPERGLIGFALGFISSSLLVNLESMDSMLVSAPAPLTGVEAVDNGSNLKSKAIADIDVTWAKRSGKDVDTLPSLLGLLVRH